MPGFLAPSPRWSALSQTGFPAVGGKLYTYEANSTTPKATYLDAALLVENTNPITLDSKGEHIIYWNDNGLYRLELFDANGNKIWTQDNYPVVGAGGSLTVNYYDNRENLVRNPQFTFWENTDAFTSLNLDDDIASDWKFRRNNTNATVSISAQAFGLGQTDVPYNPINYLEYECTVAGTGETYKQIYQPFKNVQTLANQSASFSFYAKSASLSVIEVTVDQFFGTGGSPSSTVSTSILTETLTANWAKYTGSISIPNVNGKTLGSNGDDEVRLCINLPLNATATIDIVNIQFQWGNTHTTFPYLTQEKDFQRIKQLINEAIFPTGRARALFGTEAADGWLLMSDGTIGNANSNASQLASTRTKALFNYLWNNVSNSWCPVFNSSGAPITRGATADDDFNANYQLAIPRVLGRVLAGAGLGGSSMQFTADAGTDLLTIPATLGLQTGTAFTVTTTDTLPAPLALATTYYAILVSSTTIQVATSQANALAGTAINITSAGVGIQTLQYALNATYALGQHGGEERHVQLEGEVGAHLHNSPTGSFLGDTPNNLNAGSPGGPGGVFSQTAIAGFSNPFNIIQPTLFVNYEIKL